MLRLLRSLASPRGQELGPNLEVQGQALAGLGGQGKGARQVRREEVQELRMLPI